VPRVVRVCGIELRSGGHTVVGGRPHVRLSLPPGRCHPSGVGGVRPAGCDPLHTSATRE
jgi:hypothetical protein